MFYAQSTITVRSGRSSTKIQSNHTYYTSSSLGRSSTKIQSNHTYYTSLSLGRSSTKIQSNHTSLSLGRSSTKIQSNHIYYTSLSLGRSSAKIQSNHTYYTSLSCQHSSKHWTSTQLNSPTQKRYVTSLLTSFFIIFNRLTVKCRFVA